MALTVIPIVAKDFLPKLDISQFSSIIGVSTIVGNLNLLSDFLSLSKDINDNPYWVLWKWKKKTENKKKMH